MSFQVNGVAVNAPVGTIVAYVNNTLPNGWLGCNGQNILETQYPSLYAFLGGTGPNTVVLPNLNRGLFLRGIGNTTYGNTGYTGPSGIYDVQMDSVRDHKHSRNYWTDPKQGGGTVQFINNLNAVSGTPKYLETTYNTIPPDGEDETRPINYGILWIIKA